VCIQYVVWEASIDTVSDLGVNRDKKRPNEATRDSMTCYPFEFKTTGSGPFFH